MIGRISQFHLFAALLCLSLLGASGQPEDCFAKFTKNFSDSGLDTDGDGRYDTLNINVGVQANNSGEYSITGFLYDPFRREMAWSMDHRNLSAGYNTMNLQFDGKAIGKHGINGRYLLSNLTLLSGSSINSRLNICQALRDAYLTSPYNATDFGDSISEDNKILSGSGKGELLLTLSVETTLPVFEGGYSYDIAGLNIPPFCTPVEIIGLGPEKYAHGGYDYRFENVYIPAKPNNFTIIASGVRNLNVGLKKNQGDLYRTWISSQVQADNLGQAKIESDLISPSGSYQAKIFGDAKENVSEVGLQMIVQKKIIVNGQFNLCINATGFPSGDYSIIAKAVNGTFSLDQIAMTIPSSQTSAAHPGASDIPRSR
jgi:hypothetical protein